jgi:hypothetical protein
MAKRKTWIAIVVGMMAVCGLAIIALVGGSVYWIATHVEHEVTSGQDAANEFARERERFTNQQPVLEMSGGDTPTVRRTPAPAARSAGPMQTLHARFYDPEAGELTRADVPFWLIRTASSLTFLPEMGSLTLEEIEKHGPGLLVNGSGETGEQILIWID